MYIQTSTREYVKAPISPLFCYSHGSIMHTPFGSLLVFVQQFLITIPNYIMKSSLGLYLWQRGVSQSRYIIIYLIYLLLMDIQDVPVSSIFNDCMIFQSWGFTIVYLVVVIISCSRTFKIISNFWLLKKAILQMNLCAYLLFPQILRY